MLARDSAVRVKMGESAREHVAQRFSVERLVEDVEALYDELLGR
jgi:glycosyltransferase involved in cell wall biosynthesis